VKLARKNASAAILDTLSTDNFISGEIGRRKAQMVSRYGIAYIAIRKMTDG
jgi:hypothetical protein